MNMTTITIINFIQAPRSGVCPLLCSGQGDYINGECVCKPGWKGKECNIRYCQDSHDGDEVEDGDDDDDEVEDEDFYSSMFRYEECEVPDCSGHGHCQVSSIIIIIITNHHNPFIIIIILIITCRTGSASV